MAARREGVSRSRGGIMTSITYYPKIKLKKVKVGAEVIRKAIVKDKKVGDRIWL